MLAADVITAWAVDHPWPTADQVQQDLLLSQAICEIANDPYLGEELTFRGGTCLHKLHVGQPYGKTRRISASELANLFSIERSSRSWPAEVK